MINDTTTPKESNAAKQETGGGWMRLLVRPLLSATSIAALMWCAWLAVNGSEGAGRILQFAAWFMATTIVGAVCPEEFEDERSKGLPLPRWIHFGTGIALILFLVWHGWIWTAIALVLHEIGTASIYRTNARAMTPGANENENE
jgi:hypothetical protein